MKFNNKNVSFGENVKLGKNVKIGDNTTIYDNVIIEDNTIICNDCVIGEPMNDYYSNTNYKNPITIIGANSLIRSHAIIYAGCEFGEGLNTGHNVIIREKTVAGKYCSFGTQTDIQGSCNIGDYARFHSFVNIGQFSSIGNFVFIYPFVVLTNDPKPPSTELNGPSIGDYTQIASGSILLSGIELGMHNLVSANSMVNSNFEDYSVIAGNPAKYVSDIRKLPIFTEGKRHYPWPYSYDRGMPWKKEDYDIWLKEND
jgi:acetyltransferase-like isoleucine patch superfamily enzyme